MTLSFVLGRIAKIPSKLEQVKQLVTSSTPEDSAVSSPPSKLKHTTVDIDKLKSTSDPASVNEKSEKGKIEDHSQSIPPAGGILSFTMQFCKKK